MTNNEEAGVPSIRAGLVVGMLIGIPVGFVLGQAAFDSMAMGLVLGGGAGGVLGVTLRGVPGLVNVRWTPAAGA
ncbi:hypothetical protein [Streptomyces massasporeus]|uniref:hypothetical protein n=1 Tax=Streptomyces massasporeus TaxID=67324 RepID=UPI003658D5C7